MGDISSYIFHSKRILSLNHDKIHTMVIDNVHDYFNECNKPDSNREGHHLVVQHVYLHKSCCKMDASPFKILQLYGILLVASLHKLDMI